jgi:sugar phosphate permease
MNQKRRRRLIEQAQSAFEEGEQVREVMVGQTFMSPVLYLLIVPFLFVFMVRARVAMVTDRNVYMFEGSVWSTKKLNRLLEKYPIGSAPVSLTAMSLTIGNEKAYAYLFQFAAMKQIAARANPGGAQPEPAQAGAA